ncbi:hypothetical protein SUGI_1133460 [Cryptomeria japonica]|nr:hypothetical protein SUGI_1133460 [Cryptomeria japonica]
MNTLSQRLKTKHTDKFNEAQKRRQLGAQKPDEKNHLLMEEVKEQAKQDEMIVEEEKKEKTATIPSQEDVEATNFVILKVCDPNKATSLEAKYQVDKEIMFSLQRRKSKEGIYLFLVEITRKDKPKFKMNQIGGEEQGTKARSTIFRQGSRQREAIK